MPVDDYDFHVRKEKPPSALEHDIPSKKLPTPWEFTGHTPVSPAFQPGILT